mgnify:CR=1 FL=1
MSKLFTVLLLVLVMFTLTTAQEFFLPFMQKAVTPITVDGVLDEWNFCFPIDVRESTIPPESRCHDWYPDGDDDISATIMLMWDETYLYVAANIRDDVPGVLSAAQSWDEDAVEIYLANWDVGQVPWDPNGNGMQDSDNGELSTQLNFHYDVLGDSVRIFQHHPNNKVIKSALTEAMGVEWPNGDGYVLEAKVAWEDLGSEKGNTFDLVAGDVIPFTFSLYDRDDWDTSDWAGLVMSERDEDAWKGPGKGWQVMEVRDTRETPFYKDSNPYMKQTPYPVTIDGNLDEWSFCFPVDMNMETIPDYSRANGWLPDDNEDLSGAIKLMFDEDYLYVSAAVRDVLPGVVPQHGEWNQDAIELYIGNYDIFDMMGEVEHDGYINLGDMVDVQLSFYYDSDLDSVLVKLWNPVDEWVMGGTMGAGQVWPDGDGYNIEVAVSLEDIAVLVDPDNAARTFDFVNGVYEIWPATYALYDKDDYDADDWSGYQFVSDAGAPWKRPGGGGWEGIQLLPVNEYDILQDLWDTYTGVEENSVNVVANYRLSQNYPNPFNPTTSIVFELQKSENVTLKVFNVLGEEVATVLNGVQTAGAHRIQFDGAELNGGVYFYQLTAGDYSETRRMVLLK